MNLICVSGLPRSGSTLLCQLLAQHPEVYSTGHSSPLVSVLENIRSTFSSNDFSLAQLDVDFDLAYGRMGNVLRSVLEGWFQETDKQHVVDKNRGWLRMAEMLNELHDDWRILVCVRDLTQIYGSIEKQHAKTRLLNFADGTDAHGAMARADQLFGKGGVVGGPLNFISDIQDIQDPRIHERIQYVPFEYLMQKPAEAVEEMFGWLGLSPHKINPNKLTTRPHESDSYYRFKYRHETREAITAPARHIIPPRVEEGLRKNYKWYFDQFYPS
ncbi:hypothetical protein GCM10011309_27660 [Litorimonas cladophorae]|uniref:Sulfotransferase n=1 Tax=Litorimonas cladophorae TaxID=1220491 RepID=A0A918KVK3_9PROT|nr:sulfotransferase [Litorimonas cladophorae]GGX76053.1 hypothetical protein GCM10011309_27660 [Litorimonas cladophorae]